MWAAEKNSNMMTTGRVSGRKRCTLLMFDGQKQSNMSREETERVSLKVALEANLSVCVTVSLRGRAQFRRVDQLPRQTGSSA